VVDGQAGGVESKSVLDGKARSVGQADGVDAKEVWLRASGWCRRLRAKVDGGEFEIANIKFKISNLRLLIADPKSKPENSDSKFQIQISELQCARQAPHKSEAESHSHPAMQRPTHNL